VAASSAARHQRGHRRDGESTSAAAENSSSDSVDDGVDDGDDGDGDGGKDKFWLLGPNHTDRARLEACVQGLKDILGPLISEDQLAKVAVAADCDVNRAVNFYLQEEEKGGHVDGGEEEVDESD